MDKKIFIIGTGGFAREVLYLIDRLDLFNQVSGFMEPDDIWEKSWKDKELMGLPVLPMNNFDPKLNTATIAIGNSKIRELTTKQLPSSTDYIKLIDKSASVSRWANISEGCIITAGCIVTTQIEIGKHCHLNLDTTVGHDCKIQDYFTTAPSVNLSGDCTIDNHVYFGTGSATRQGIDICQNVVIGMGAMVVKNISEAGIYVGIPAKKKN